MTILMKINGTHEVIKFLNIRIFRAPLFENQTEVEVNRHCINIKFH